MSLGSVLKKIGEDVLKVVEYPFKETGKIISVLETVIKEEPEVKTAVTGLVKAFGAISGDVLADIASKGINLETDLKTLQDVQNVFAYFQNSFVPVVVKVWKDLEGDLEGAPAPAAAATIAAPAGEASSLPVESSSVSQETAGAPAGAVA